MKLIVQKENLNGKDDFGLPEGFDMSSLDDLDALMKEAGL